MPISCVYFKRPSLFFTDSWKRSPSLTPPSNGLYVSGRLGLDTATPSYKLHVVGTDPYATIVRIDNGGLNVNIPWSTGDESIGIRSDAGISVYGSGMTGVYGTGYQGVYGVGQGEGDGVFGYSEEGDRDSWQYG